MTRRTCLYCLHVRNSRPCTTTYKNANTSEISVISFDSCPSSPWGYSRDISQAGMYAFWASSYGCALDGLTKKISWVERIISLSWNAHTEKLGFNIITNEYKNLYRMNSDEADDDIGPACGWVTRNMTSRWNWNSYNGAGLNQTEKLTCRDKIGEEDTTFLMSTEQGLRSMTFQPGQRNEAAVIRWAPKKH